MDDREAILLRHSVREYKDIEIDKELEKNIQDEINKINSINKFNFQLVVNDQKTFGGFMAHYGKFKNCKNYIALIANKGKEEQIGYFGEQLVLLLQKLGLNSCWVALTYSKRNVKKLCNKNEILYLVIAFGYGVTQGVHHKSKTTKQVTDDITIPEWFQMGINSALLAPTALNQQKFFFSIKNNSIVTIKNLKGPYSSIDLGIVKLHFEIGAGTNNFIWSR